MDNFLGWIKLHRELLLSNFWKQANSYQKSLIVTIALLAHHTENVVTFNNISYTCTPGQLLCTYNTLLCPYCKGMSLEQLKYTLQSLADYKIIEIKHLIKDILLITLVDWDKYQTT